MKWEDITAYSRYDELRKPHWWMISLGRLRLSVGDSHIYYPDNSVWLMNCEPWYERYALNAKTEAEAKAEALSLVQARLTESLKALKEAQ